MNTRLLLAGALALAAVSPLGAADTANPPPAAPPATVHLSGEDRRQAIEGSRDLFRKGETIAGEEMLFSINRSADGTPEWNLEAAGSLLTMACLFLQEDNGAKATEIAERALRRFARARIDFNGVPRYAAAIESQIGFIQQRIIGNREAAKAAYRAAVALFPQGSAGAANALKRLEDEDRIASQRPARASN